MPREKLTTDTHSIIINALRRGAYLNTAAQRAGITAKTIEQWRKRGAEDLASNNRRRQTSPYAMFESDVQSAQAEIEVACVQHILRIGQNQNQWKAIAWYLERTRPHKYGRASLEMAAADGRGPLVMEPDTHDTLVRQVEAKLAAIRHAERMLIPANVIERETVDLE